MPCAHGRHCPSGKDHASGSFHKFLKVTCGVQLLILDFYLIFGHLRGQDNTPI